MNWIFSKIKTPWTQQFSGEVCQEVSNLKLKVFKINYQVEGSNKLNDSESLLAEDDESEVLESDELLLDAFKGWFSSYEYDVLSFDEPFWSDLCQEPALIAPSDFDPSLLVP